MSRRRASGIRAVAARALLLGAILFVPFAACTSVGVIHCRQVRQVRGLVPVAEVVDPIRVPDGTFVDVEVTPRLLAADELPLDDRVAAVEHGTRVFDVAETTRLLVTCTRTSCSAVAATPSGSARLSGRVCGVGAVVACTMSPELSAFTRSEAERRRLRPESLRVLLVGETVRGPTTWMALAFSFDGLLVVALVLLLVQSSRGRRGGPRLSEAREYVVGGAADELRRALLGLAGVDGLSWDEEDAGAGLVFSQGRSEMAVRIWGMTRPEHVARRGRIDLRETPYRGCAMRVEVEEDVRWVPDLGSWQRLEALCRLALTRTFLQVEDHLKAKGLRLERP